MRHEYNTKTQWFILKNLFKNFQQLKKRRYLEGQFTQTRIQMMLTLNSGTDMNSGEKEKRTKWHKSCQKQLQSKVKEKKQQKTEIHTMLVVAKNTCRMQIGRTIPLKTCLTWSNVPYKHQTVLAQVHELYNIKTWKQNRTKHNKNIHSNK